jgi:hypothetical protein
MIVLRTRQTNRSVNEKHFDASCKANKQRTLDGHEWRTGLCPQTMKPAHTAHTAHTRSELVLFAIPQTNTRAHASTQYQVCFGCLLQCQDGRRLEPQVILEILGNLPTHMFFSWQSVSCVQWGWARKTHLTNKPLKGKLANQQVSRLLVPPAHTQRFTLEYTVRVGGDASLHLISRSATTPGRYRWGFLTPPVAGADFCAQQGWQAVCVGLCHRWSVVPSAWFVPLSLSAMSLGSTRPNASGRNVSRSPSQKLFLP